MADNYQDALIKAIETISKSQVKPRVETCDEKNWNCHLYSAII